MSLHVEVAHHGDNGSYIKAQLNNDKGVIWIEATDPKHPEWRTTAFLTDDQAEQIHDLTGQHLVAIGRREPAREVEVYECSTCDLLYRPPKDGDRDFCPNCESDMVAKLA